MRLYGVDGEETRDVGALNAFFLIPDRPEVFNLPPKPVLPSTFQPAAYTAARSRRRAGAARKRACSAAMGNARRVEVSQHGTARIRRRRELLARRRRGVAAARRRRLRTRSGDVLRSSDPAQGALALGDRLVLLRRRRGGGELRARVARRSAAAIPTTPSSCATAATPRSRARSEQRAAGQRSRPARAVFEHAAHREAQVADVRRRLRARRFLDERGARGARAGPSGRIVSGEPVGWIARPLARAPASTTALMASYTGVLLSATAIPVWFTGRRHMPAVFACSAAIDRRRAADRCCSRCSAARPNREEARGGRALRRRSPKRRCCWLGAARRRERQAVILAGSAAAGSRR